MPYERRFMRRIFGPVCVEGRCILNHNALSFIKSRRLAWLGHVIRMHNNRMPKSMMDGQIYAVRTLGERGLSVRNWGNGKDFQYIRGSRDGLCRRLRPVVGCSAKGKGIT